MGAVGQVQDRFRKAPGLLIAAPLRHRRVGEGRTGLGAERRTPKSPLHPSLSPWPLPRLPWPPPVEAQPSESRLAWGERDEPSAEDPAPPEHPEPRCS